MNEVVRENLEVHLGVVARLLLTPDFSESCSESFCDFLSDSLLSFEAGGALSILLSLASPVLTLGLLAFRAAAALRVARCRPVCERRRFASSLAGLVVVALLAGA